MNAALKAELVISLTGDETLPRRLRIAYREAGELCVCLYPLKRQRIQVYVNKPIAECRLEIEREELWIGSTSFDVTAAEAVEIAQKLAPHGLRVTAPRVADDA